MNIRELKESLPYLFEAQQTAFIWGHAGIGKTTVVKEYAKQKNYKFFAFYLGTQSDLGDILGLQEFVRDEKGKAISTAFASPEWLVNTIDYCNQNPDSGAVIFLDEFNRGRKDILNGMFSLALDKTFHTLKLPKNCYIIAAGNPPTEEYFTTDVEETALMARFTHIKLEPTFDEWLEYAKEQEYDASLTSFLAEQPSLLSDKKTDFKLPVKVDNRSWGRLQALMDVNTPKPLLEKLAAGIIGIERLVAYQLFLQKTETPVSGKDVLKGERLEDIRVWSNPKDIKTSLLNGTTTSVTELLVKRKSKALTETEADNLLEFIEILPKDIGYPFLKNLKNKEVETFLEMIKLPKYHDKLLSLVKEAKGL